MVREAEQSDLDAILELYLFLHEDSIPEKDEHLRDTWLQIIQDPNHHLIVNEVDGKIVSSCVCVKTAKTMMPEAEPELPYEGAKEMLLVDNIENKEFLKELLEGMYGELPTPKKKK